MRAAVRRSDMVRKRPRFAVATSIAMTVIAGSIATGCTQDDPAPVNRGRGSPAPIKKLTDADLHELLVVQARASAADTCTPGAVEARLVGFDAAAGHRFTSLRLRNDSEHTCVLGGVPGIGVRGEKGSVFTVTVESALKTSAHRGAVALAPGQKAAASIEWSGVLAGATDERASELVVQLAREQVPLLVPASLEGDPAGAEALDIGTSTTLRVGPFSPVSVPR